MLQDRKFVKACAECKEVLDRRLGKQPATKHRPHDFLNPGWSEDSGDDEEERLNDLRPLPASADKLSDCSAEQALLWLHTVACTPLERPKVNIEDMSLQVLPCGIKLELVVCKAVTHIHM